MKETQIGGTAGQGTLRAEGTIGEQDVDIVFVTDSPEEAVAHIAKHALGGSPKWGLRKGKLKRRLRQPPA